MFVIRSLIFAGFLVFTSLSYVAGQTSLYNEMKTALDEGLLFLEKNQIKETIPAITYAGEWPNYMCLQRGFIMLGKKRCLEDSNCFAVASIHNALAHIYLAHPSYERIPKMLDAAFPRIASYKNGLAFNFWNLLPPTRNLKRGVVPDPQPHIRRPTNYDLYSIFVNNASNVVDDADDTAMANIAMALRRKISSSYPLSDEYHFETDSLGFLLDQYRDQDRKNRHWYNVFTGNDHDTGAYLTWIGQEYQFKNWNFIFDFFHSILFLMPFSECYPHPYVPYIPYGSNNIDAIVNSNVIASLTLNNIESEGRASALKYIEKKSKKRNYRRVGSYYPNSYHFPYAVSEAYANGVTELKQSTDNICRRLLKKQAKDGSWKSKRNLNNRDRVMSTTYALNALINFGDIEKRRTGKAIEKAIRYLLSHQSNTDEGLHWEAGVFFSGGTVVRNNLVWKSEAFTTVTILKAFALYMKHLEQQYPDMNFNSPAR